MEPGHAHTSLCMTTRRMAMRMKMKNRSRLLEFVLVVSFLAGQTKAEDKSPRTPVMDNNPSHLSSIMDIKASLTGNPLNRPSMQDPQLFMQREATAERTRELSWLTREQDNTIRLSHRERTPEDNKEPGLFREKQSSEEKVQVLSRQKRLSEEQKAIHESSFSRDKRQTEETELALSRQKRTHENKQLDSEPLLSREKRASEDTELSKPSISRQNGWSKDLASVPYPHVSRETREGDDTDLVISREKLVVEKPENAEPALSSQMRKEQVVEPVLFRQKQNSNDPDPLRLRQKRSNEEAEPALFRQKRVDETAEPVLHRQKRVDEAAEPVLHRQKRVDETAEPVLHRQKRVNEAAEPVLHRQKRVDEAAEPVLHRQKRVDETAEPVLYRQKRVDETAKPVLHRQKRVDEVAEPVLHRQKRVDEIAEPVIYKQKRVVDDNAEPVLHRQKRVDENESAGPEPAIYIERGMTEERKPESSRQKRGSRGQDTGSQTVRLREAAMSENTEDSQAAVSGQNSVNNDRQNSEPIPPRQKRMNEDFETIIQKIVNINQEVPDQNLPRQKRVEPEHRYKEGAQETDMSRVKITGLKDAPLHDEETAKFVVHQTRTNEEDRELSRQKRFESVANTDDHEHQKEASILNSKIPMGNVEIYRQQMGRLSEFSVRDKDLLFDRLPNINDPSTDESSIFQIQKKDESLVQEEESVNFFTPLSRQKRQLLASNEEQSPDENMQTTVSKQEAELMERQKHAPEHKLYNEDLLLRRTKEARMESKKRKKSKDTEMVPENEDSWEQELRIRRELAQKAIEYGIQKKKERMEHPVLNKDLSILQRVRQDAEEIMKRRAVEAAYFSMNTLQKPITSFTPAGEEEDENGESEEQIRVAKQEKKKTEKAIGRLLNLKGPKQKRKSSGRIPTETEKAKQPEIIKEVAITSSHGEALGFANIFLKGKINRKSRKKRKKRNKVFVRNSGKKKHGQFPNTMGVPGLTMYGT